MRRTADVVKRGVRRARQRLHAVLRRGASSPPGEQQPLQAVTRIDFWVWGFVLLYPVALVATNWVAKWVLWGDILRLVFTISATQAATVFGSWLISALANRLHREGDTSATEKALEWIANHSRDVDKAAAKDLLNQSIAFMAIFILVLGEWIAQATQPPEASVWAYRLATVYCPFVAVLALTAYVAFWLGRELPEVYRARSDLAYSPRNRGLLRFVLLIPPGRSTLTWFRGIWIGLYSLMVLAQPVDARCEISDLMQWITAEVFNWGTLAVLLIVSLLYLGMRDAAHAANTVSTSGSRDNEPSE